MDQISILEQSCSKVMDHSHILEQDFYKRIPSDYAYAHLTT